MTRMNTAVELEKNGGGGDETAKYEKYAKGFLPQVDAANLCSLTVDCLRQ